MPASRTARLAWLVPGAVFAAATIGWGTVAAVDVLAHERYSERTEYTEPIRILDIEADRGSVTIVGTETDTVTIDMTISEGLRAGENEQRVEGDRLVIRSDCPIMFSIWCGVDYTIRVPAATSVVAHSSGSGIEVTGIRGDAELSSSGGGVRVSGGGGTLTLESSGGGIRGELLTADVVSADSSGGGVRLTFVEAPRTVRASSSGGGVSVEVPDTPDGYRVEASSSGGGVSTDVRTNPESPRVINAESSGGGVTIRPPAG